MTVQNDGKKLIAGVSADSNSNNLVALVRYDSIGVADSSFGINGKVIMNLGFNFQFFVDIKLQSNGKIVALAKCQNFLESGIYICRFNIDGSIDSTFDSDGKFLVLDTYENFIPTKLAIQVDNKILVCGNKNNPMDTAFVSRINPNGGFDNSFGINGIEKFKIGNTYTRFLDMKLDFAGNIFLAGGIGNNSGIIDVNILIIKLGSSGTLDISFGTNGKRVISFGVENDYLTNIELQSDGKILLAGITYNSNDHDIFLIRLDALGNDDLSFNSISYSFLDILALDEVCDIAIQSDNKIVITGYTSNTTSINNYQIYLARFNAYGILDSTFDLDGIYLTTLNGISSFSCGLQAEPTGRLVVGGHVGNLESDFALYRYRTLSPNDLELTLLNQSYCLYPNPAKSELNIIGLRPNEKFSYKLVNMNGNVIKGGGLFPSGNAERINLNNLMSGIYILSVFDSKENILVSKLIILE